MELRNEEDWLYGIFANINRKLYVTNSLMPGSQIECGMNPGKLSMEPRELSMQLPYLYLYSGPGKEVRNTLFSNRKIFICTSQYAFYKIFFLVCSQPAFTVPNKHFACLESVVGKTPRTWQPTL